MKERPILFSAPMVRAIIEGRKTQTRRIVKTVQLGSSGILGVRVAPRTFCYLDFDGVPGLSWRPVGWGPTVPFALNGTGFACPYGSPGDLLWVKETWALHPDEHPDEAGILFRATDTGWDDSGSGLKWKPSIFMPRSYSRITLEIVNVRVDRLQEISEEDAKAEGIECGIYCGEDDEGPALRSIDCENDEMLASYRDGFRFTWECINGEASWELNPWVWVIEFKRIK